MEALIKKFYTAFNDLDAETMVSCYHKDIIFEDPAFGTLNSDKAKMMWRMLCESQTGKEFKVKYSNINIQGSNGNAIWEAFYTFSKTQRKVHNVISARFEFRDGLIIKHTDIFNLHRWAKQAFGFKGYIIGGTGFFRKKLQEQTSRTLKVYMDKKKRTD